MTNTRLGLLAVLAIALAACSGTASLDDTGVDFTAPTSTAPTPTELVAEGVDTSEQAEESSAPGIPRRIENTAPHFFSHRPIVERIGDHAEYAIKGKLVSIGNARLATPSGGWETSEDPQEILNQAGLVSVITDLEIEVTEILGERMELPSQRRVGPRMVDSPRVSAGTVIRMSIVGGDVTHQLTAFEAEVLRIRPEVPHELEQQSIDEGGEEIEMEIPESGLTITRHVPYAVGLSEGDELIAFLRVDSWFDGVANDGSPVPDLLFIKPVHPTGLGLYVRGDDGSYQDAGGGEPTKEADLIGASRAVSRLRGPVEAFDPISLYTIGSD